MKSKKLAGLLSVIWPGLGHLYLRRYTDGIVFLAGAGVLWAIILIKSSYLWEMGEIKELIFWGGFAAVYIYALIDVLKK